MGYEQSLVTLQAHRSQLIAHMSDSFPRLVTALAGRYTVERELGRGGMATVYLAHDLKHDRQVAIKVLLPELAAALGGERFVQEIKVTAGLQHPHILPLFDSGRIGGQADGRSDDLLYYVMPYVEGESLRDLLDRESPLEVERALAIVTQVAGALDYAHRHGVVHRDIKPENILLEEGEAMVADFGIALAVEAAGPERLTAVGVAIGTPAYMSPEHISGERIDGRSDVYALACVYYEMVTGQPPFDGPTPHAVMARSMAEPLKPASASRRGLSPEIDTG
jgi:serine/threonine-protein kinase